MNFKEEKQKRINYLREVYKVAKEKCPTSPTDAVFILSKADIYIALEGKDDFMNIDNDGYTIGRRLGLGQQDVDSILNYFTDRKVGYMYSTLGRFQINITQHGIMYLESLEEESFIPLQINYITTGNINSPTQFQQGLGNLNQTQTIEYTQENVKELFNLLEAAIKGLDFTLQEDINNEMNYAKRQLDKGKDIKPQLLNIGIFVKDVGMNVFANLLASPLFEVLKPMLGL